MLDFTVNPEGRAAAIRQAKSRGIVIPTLAQQAGREPTPPAIRARLATTELWSVDPVNLFRIRWDNEPRPDGGGFGGINYLELPPGLTGVATRIVALVGKWFPTGAHKVGAAFGCLVPPLVTGQFDPERHQAAWPSTGNFCRGGAYDSAVLGCRSIAILPEGMSRERFDWLATIAGRVIKTPGTESNVKEIFDECWRLRQSGQEISIFNQFEDLGNYLWHYAVTGPAVARVLEGLGPRARYHGLTLATGSAGTIASGDYLKTLFPASKIAAVEATQCPTMLRNGYGSHRIEGIGDKHIPWIHNVRNTDVVIGVDDQAPLDLIRLFNEPAGRRYLGSLGISQPIIDSLPLVGISGACNLVAAIKLAKLHGTGPDDVIVTVLTDSIDLYQSRLAELRQAHGELTDAGAMAAHHRYLKGLGTDEMIDLTLDDRRRIHNLKYFTWVEQQGRAVAELDRQWADPTYWSDLAAQSEPLDALIDEFNREVAAA